MDNSIEIHDGDFHLKIYLDKLWACPVPVFHRLICFLRAYPEELERIGAYLKEQMVICEAGLAGRHKEYLDGWRRVNPRSRSPAAREILAENKRLVKNLRQAKHLFDTYTRLFQIYENQGGTYL